MPQDVTLILRNSDQMSTEDSSDQALVFITYNSRRPQHDLETSLVVRKRAFHGSRSNASRKPSLTNRQPKNASLGQLQHRFRLTKHNQKFHGGDRREHRLPPSVSPFEAIFDALGTDGGYILSYCMNLARISGMRQTNSSRPPQLPTELAGDQR